MVLLVGLVHLQFQNRPEDFVKYFVRCNELLHLSLIRHSLLELNYKIAKF